jgi:HSP20 family protein
MSIVKYRPQSTLVGPFGELVHEFLGRDIGQFFGSDDLKRNVPHVNILERTDGFELQMMAPGYSKQDLKLSMENEILTISAERKKEELKEGERFTRREFLHSSFSRSFRLPESVDAEGIQAEFTDGILRIRIPKAAAAKPKTREISIG